MRIVIDNNVVISAALIKNSISYRVFEKALAQEIIINSVPVFSELVEVINRPKFDKYLRPQDKGSFVRKYFLLSNLNL